MTPRNRRPACIAALLLLLPLNAARAQDKGTTVATFRAGLKDIAIPAPTSDLVEIGSDYRVILEPLAPNANRLIAAFILPSDLPAIRAGTTIDLDRYALVEVPRRAEFLDVTPEIYKTVAGSLAEQFGVNLEAVVKEGTDELNQRLKNLNSSAGSISINSPVQLGAFFSETDACGFGLIASVTANGSTWKRVAAIMMVRVQNRVICAYLYVDYKDDDSVRWLRTASQRWAEAILKANQ